MVRLAIGAIVAAFAFFSYQCSTEYNPVTGEEQHVAMTPEQEIALGLQAAPEMAARHGGLLDDAAVQALVDRVGADLVRSGAARDTGWQFEFHVLADPQTVNAFALPGGQIFITDALLRRFSTEGELAGVIGHEIGHVVARHGAQRLAKMQLTEGITGAVLVAAGGGGSEAQIAQMVGQLVNMKYGREDELESDTIGVMLVAAAGYDPRALIRVMKILDDASGGNAPPEWMSTHPSHGNRVARIEAAIEEVFPAGIPDGLQQ
ncbi:MAG: M48 family metallopeptidase [Woeseia sp.]|nr:M48 family metallopeptidase [Woeseia sp.]